MITEDKLSKFYKWSATVVTLVGALFTSLAIDPYNVYLLKVGAVLFLIWAIRVREPAMIAVNAGLLAIYIIGVVRVMVA
jgi:hypothetical protein